MSTVVQRLFDAGILGPLDVFFARTLDRLCPGQPEDVLLGAALASRAIAHGHVCADLRRLASEPLHDEAGETVAVELPSPWAWTLSLGSSPLVGDGTRPTPLVLDEGSRLYLFRYHAYQVRLADALRSRARLVEDDAGDDALRASLQRLFAPGGEGPSLDPRQRLAAAVAMLRRLTVISGGPGTGKTTTVLRILAAAVERARHDDRATPRILLLAPTGKAATRLAESVQLGKRTLACDESIKDAIPESASTIHRALGFRPWTPTRFVHDADNPLPADVVVVDESSMVDLALMAKLVDAVPPRARLILLGDRNQLASVEAGAILGDICGGGEPPGRSAAFAARLERIVGPERQVHPSSPPPIADCIVELEQSHRFGSDSVIGNLARAINRGAGREACEILEAGHSAARLVKLREPGRIREVLRDDVVAAFADMLEAKDPEARLLALGRYRLLSPHRRGPFGTERLNLMIEEILADAGLLRPSQAHYDGRPIIVTRNDYQLELFNGDVGVIVGDGHRARAWFFGQDGSLRSFLPARLPPHESVWAMTVHKSQGSELDAVGFLIPSAVSRLLTRELLYTAITRARTKVTLYGDAETLVQAASRRIERASGLREALWDA